MNVFLKEYNGLVSLYRSVGLSGNNNTYISINIQNLQNTNILDYPYSKHSDLWNQC